MTCSGTEEVTLSDTKKMRHAGPVGARRKARVDRAGIHTQGVCFKQKAEMVKWCEGLLEIPVVTKDGKLLAEEQEQFTCLHPTVFHFLTTTFNIRR